MNPIELARIVRDALKRTNEERTLRNQVVSDLKRHEGLRLKAYLDTVGVWTIGYGHTGPEVTPGLVVSEAKAEEWLRVDIDEAIEDVKAVAPWAVEELDVVRRGVLINMAFNLGREGLKQFNRQSLPAIRDGRYLDASNFLDKSLWRKQVKGRAVELIERIKSGTIEPKHQVK